MGPIEAMVAGLPKTKTTQNQGGAFVFQTSLAFSTIVSSPRIGDLPEVRAQRAGAGEVRSAAEHGCVRRCIAAVKIW